LDGASASVIAEWAASKFGESCRLVDPADLRVTLLFIPKVTGEDRHAMVDLLRQVEWTTLRGLTGQTSLDKRGGLALEVILPVRERELLDDRIGRLNWAATPEEFEAKRRYHDRLGSEPLAKLAAFLDAAEIERRHRDHRHRRPLRLYVTFARTRAKREEVSLPSMPAVSVSLSEAVLYETHQNAGGVEHEVLAQTS
jgi:2'-5' RNA ligase